MSKTYYCMREYNEHEGEAWYFFFEANEAGDEFREAVLAALDDERAEDDDEDKYQFRYGADGGHTFEEDFVVELCGAELDEGNYMPMWNNVGSLRADAAEKVRAEGTKVLYKGGIRDFAED